MSIIVQGAAPSLNQVRELNQAVIAADGRILSARREVAALETRRQPLRDRLADLEASGVVQPDLDASVVDALVADPTAEPDVDTITAAVSAARKAADVRGLQMRAIQEAIDRIGVDVAAAQARIDAAQVERQAAWVEFVVAAHGYLARKFIADFDQMRREIIEPALAMQKLDMPISDGIGKRAIIGFNGDNPRLDERMEVQVRLPSSGGARDEYLFPYRKYEGGPGSDPIADFRNTLRVHPAS